MLPMHILKTKTFVTVFKRGTVRIKYMTNKFDTRAMTHDRSSMAISTGVGLVLTLIPAIDDTLKFVMFSILLLYLFIYFVYLCLFLEEKEGINYNVTEHT